MNLVELTPALRNAVERPALAEHHPIWIDILRGIGEDARGFAVEENGRVEGWILFTVARALGLTVVSSLPYVAYGGPCAGDERVSRLLLQALQSIDCDILGVGGSPLLSPRDEAVLVEELRPTHRFENPVQLQSLETHPLSQLPKKRRDALQSEIRRARGGGLTIIDRLDGRQLDQWLEIYRTRYTEIGATPYPDAFHRELHRQGVPAGVAEFRGVVEAATGRVVGGIVFLIGRESATYFSSAFTSDTRHLYPTAFLLADAFEVFRDRGIRTFNWHSSPSQGGVHSYKKRWGARPHRHLYLSMLRNDRVFALAPDEIRRAFPLRFVVPFSAFADYNSAER